jgi:hypothetical protein
MGILKGGLEMGMKRTRAGQSWGHLRQPDMLAGCLVGLEDAGLCGY